MDDLVQCPDCGRWFLVVWANDGLGPPEYCPMCGTEINFEDLE